MIDATPFTAEQILAAVRGGARLRYLPRHISQLAGDPSRCDLWLDKRRLEAAEEACAIISLVNSRHLRERYVEAGVTYLYATEAA